MAFVTFKTILVFAFLIAVAQGATLTTTLDSLKRDPIRRCGRGCSSSFIKTTFNYLIAACGTGACRRDFVLRTTPLGSGSHIQQFCVVSEPFHSPNWSMRIQADLVPGGARMVLVAVPYNSRTEFERFTRPFVLGELIPRNQLFIINQMVKNFCGLTN